MPATRDRCARACGPHFRRAAEPATALWQRAAELATALWQRAAELATALWLRAAGLATALWPRAAELATALWQHAAELATALWLRAAELAASGAGSSVCTIAASAFRACRCDEMPSWVLRGQPRPVAGELHVGARGPRREPLVFVLLLAAIRRSVERGSP